MSREIQLQKLPRVEILFEDDNNIVVGYGTKHMQDYARAAVEMDRASRQSDPGILSGEGALDDIRAEREAAYQQGVEDGRASRPADDLPKLYAALKDPHCVHALMLRGDIAKPSWRAIVDLMGEVPNGEDVQLARIAELQHQVSYLLSANAARTAGEAVAWRTFDGEGGYELRNYEDNEDYLTDWNRRNPHHIGWVQPLYLAPPAVSEDVRELVTMLHDVRNASDLPDGSPHRKKIMICADGLLAKFAHVQGEAGSA